MKHGIVASEQFRCGSTYASGDVVPHVGVHIRRDVHGAPVTDDHRRFLHRLGNLCELVFQPELLLQCSDLALIKEFVIGSEVIYSCLGKHCGYFRNREDLKAQT